MGPKLKAGDKSPDFIFETPWADGLNFYDIANEIPVVIVFLRYKGCPVCQLQMVDLKQDIDIFKSKGAQLFVVLQSAKQTITSWTNERDWPFTIICDPKAKIYELYQVRTGNPLRLVHPSVIKSGIRAMFKGFWHGKFEGRETQLPAAFVIDRNKIVRFAHYGRNPVDIPSPTVLASFISQDV